MIGILDTGLCSKFVLADDFIGGCTIQNSLVAALEPWNFMTFQYFPYIGTVIIPTDVHSIIFQKGSWKPPTSSGDYQNPLVRGISTTLW